MNTFKNNQYVRCIGIILFCMKLSGIFPFLFSHRETSKNLLLSRIISTLSILIYVLIFGQEISYLIATVNMLMNEFNFIIFIRLLLCTCGRTILISVPWTTWKNSNQMYTLWGKWQNLQEEIDGIKQARFLLPAKIILFRSLSILYIFMTFAGIPFRSSFNDYKDFAASIESFYYLGVLIISILYYWSLTCLFLVFVAREIQRLIEKAITNEQHEVIFKLVMVWLDIYDWKKEFISAHSHLFLIFIAGAQWGFITSVYSMLYILFFETEKLISLCYSTTAFFCFFILVTFCESGNLFYQQIVVRLQEILLSKNITKIDFKFLKQMEIFFLTIEVHKRQPTLNGIITLNRSTISKILAAIINYLFVLKQFHHV